MCKNKKKMDKQRLFAIIDIKDVITYIYIFIYVYIHHEIYKQNGIKHYCYKDVEINEYLYPTKVNTS